MLESRPLTRLSPHRWLLGITRLRSSAITLTSWNLTHWFDSPLSSSLDLVGSASGSLISSGFVPLMIRLVGVSSTDSTLPLRWLQPSFGYFTPLLANSTASSQVSVSHSTPWSGSAVTLGAPRRALYRCLSISLGIFSLRPLALVLQSSLRSARWSSLFLNSMLDITRLSVPWQQP